MSSRQDKVEQLIAICVKAKVDPNRTNAFATFVAQQCANRFCSSKSSIKDFTDVLIKTWRLDKWKRYVKDNVYLTVTERTEWMNSH